MQDQIHIDIEMTPDFQRIEFAKGMLELVKQIFSMPGAEEECQAWLKARKKTQADKAAKK